MGTLLVGTIMDNTPALKAFHSFSPGRLRNSTLSHVAGCHEGMVRNITEVDEAWRKRS